MRYARSVTLAGIIFLTLILSVHTSTTNQNSTKIDETIEDKSSEIIVISQTSGRGNSDLIIDYISASWSSADAGDSKSVTVRLKNQGTASSGSFYWGIYLSTDTTITTNDIELDTWYKSSISSGSSSSQYKSITIPASITGGYYYVGAIADINSQVSETNENNNDDYDTGRVHVYELPDLVPRSTSSSCSTPSTGTVGDYLDSSISIQYENDVSSSHGQSTGSFDWAMYLSSDSSITTSDTQVGSDQYSSSLSSGSYRTDSLSTSNRIPSSMNAGTYYWGYILDVNTDVDESSETNNVRTCGQ
ncbi:MAG TPA: CARDB domain-containing protein, partial [Candidatus Thalassarchaeaceae archaeon]|nr:CARDB domain-containing protein [Candidatus Thalassarchaeaceae archaeon]